jgi:hypothetical protein
MGRFSREEIEDAFRHYQEVSIQAGTTGAWDGWADLFTEDATYIEHLYGTMGGREAIRRWINDTMLTPPVNQMRYFPIEWYLIDEERGWVVCQVWNRMTDPGDGSLHQEYTFTLLKYAGDNKWSYEEDVYNPTRFQAMIKNWRKTKERLAASA